MKQKLQQILIMAGMACVPAAAHAQADIHFSQFYETSMLRNPSMTGIFSNDYKVGGFYRNQWSSISNPFVTTLGYAEVRMPIGHVSEDYLSFGLLGYSDRAGSVDQRITAFYPAINYSKSIRAESNTFLSMGMTFGYNQYSFDPSKTTFNNQFQNGFFDPNNPSLENITNAKMSMWDLGAGLNYNTSGGVNNNVTYIIGVAGYHITQPHFSYFPKADVTQNMRWNVNGAIGFDLNTDISAQIHLNYANQGTYNETIAGALFTYAQTSLTSRPVYAITFGLLYRYQDAIIPVIKMKYKNSGIAVSYDVNVSTLKEASNLHGGYEVTLFIASNFHNTPGVLRKTVCPKF